MPLCPTSSRSIAGILTGTGDIPKKVLLVVVVMCFKFGLVVPPHHALNRVIFIDVFCGTSMSFL